jgi:hypothetical protein
MPPSSDGDKASPQVEDGSLRWMDSSSESYDYELREDTFDDLNAPYHGWEIHEGFVNKDATVSYMVRVAWIVLSLPVLRAEQATGRGLHQGLTP